MERLEMQMNERYFKLGQLVATYGVTKELNWEQLRTLIKMHAELEPGELEDSDFKLNMDAVRNNERIFSCYKLEGKCYYVITEADRSVTTVLKPEEY